MSGSFRPSREGLDMVQKLASELADEPLPPLNWSRIERELYRRIGRDASQRNLAESHRDHGHGWPLLDAIARAAGVGLAAAAAAALLAIGRGDRDNGDGVPLGHDRATPLVAGLPAAGTPSDAEGILLKAGALAETRLAPTSYEVRGQFRVRLAADSAFRVLSVGPPRCVGYARPVVVELLRGSIHADVTPTPGCDVLGVQVAQTRVAVHGTSFDVTRRDDRAVVEVVAGSVAVGPISRAGATERWLVVAPARAAFSLDGAHEAEWLPPQHLVDAAGSLARIEAGTLARPASRGSERTDTPGGLSPAPAGGRDDRSATRSVQDRSPSAAEDGLTDIDSVANTAAAADTDCAAAADTDTDCAADANAAGAAAADSADSAGSAADTDTAANAGIAPAADADDTHASAVTTTERIAPMAVRSSDATTIVDQIRRCYGRQLGAAKVEFSVHSVLTLRVGPDGVVTQAVFRPPLSPTLMACATLAVRQVRLPHTQAPYTTTVTFDLTP